TPQPDTAAPTPHTRQDAHRAPAPPIAGQPMPPTGSAPRHPPRDSAPPTTPAPTPAPSPITNHITHRAHPERPPPTTIPPPPEKLQKKDGFLAFAQIDTQKTTSPGVSSSAQRRIRLSSTPCPLCSLWFFVPLSSPRRALRLCASAVLSIVPPWRAWR